MPAHMSRWVLFLSDRKSYFLLYPVVCIFNRNPLVCVPPAQELRLKEPSMMMFVAIVTWATVR